MDFINDLGKTLGVVARQVEEKSGELLEIGRLNIDVFKEEDAIRRLSRKIGELVYNAYDRGEGYGGAADELCAEISERKKKIETLRAKIKDVKKAEENNRQNKESEDAEKPREPDIPYYTAMQRMNEMKDETKGSQWNNY